MSDTQDREHCTHADPENAETVLAVIASINGLVPSIEHFDDWPRQPNEQDEENSQS